MTDVVVVVVELDLGVLARELEGERDVVWADGVVPVGEEGMWSADCPSSALHTLPAMLSTFCFGSFETGSLHALRFCCSSFALPPGLRKTYQMSDRYVPLSSKASLTTSQA